MPIKLKASVCLEMGGNPITDDDCEATKEFILNLATKLTQGERSMSQSIRAIEDFNLQLISRNIPWSKKYANNN